MAKRTAIIDIGSNSARMILIERTSRFGFYLLNETKSRVRISEGAYEHGGELQEVPMQRALSALQEFKNIASAYKAKKILCVATSAVRDAPNGKEFKRLVKKATGINIKIIDGNTEARLGAIAAANLLPITDGVTIDIGGGSTELALIRNKEVIECVSLNLGTVRLKELFFDKEKNIKKALAFIHEELQKIPPAFKTACAIGIGGTIRALSQAIMKKNDYPLDKLHGFTYSYAEEKKFIDKIIEAPVLKLKKLSIKKDRYDTIKEGSLIFREVLRHIGAKTVITSGVGVREGLFLYDLLRNCNYKFPANFQPSLRSILDRFCIDEKDAKCHYRLTKTLYEALHPQFDQKKEHEKVLLYAAKLLNIGIKIDFYEHHKHSGYICLNDLEYDLTHQEIITIAMLVRFHKKRLPGKDETKPFAKLLPPPKQLAWLSYILSLAETINKDRSCPKVTVSFTDKILTIKSEHPLYLAQEEAKGLQKPQSFALRFEKL